jgi:serine protease Do
MEFEGGVTTMEKSAIRSRWMLLVVTIVFAGVVAGGVLGSWAARNGYPLFTSGMLSPTLASNMAQPGQAPRLPDSFAPVIQPDLPGVVSISTTTVIKRSSSPFNDPFFQQFFGQQPQGVPQKEYGLGSGVIVQSDGIILTNNHVVRGADDIRVTLHDQRSFKAKVLGTDLRTDLAVLKIDATGLTALPLGASTNLRVGDIVFAIGNPFNVGETVTMGIISAKGRANVSIEGPNSIQDFIQTDAAINPGNSGGALIDTKGEVIGINTAIVSGGREGGNIGIGFAIPINLAKSVMEQIIAHGKVIRGQLGVFIQALSPEMAQQFGLSKAEGALVASVQPDSAAAKAGIKQGDIILKFNGQPVANNNELLLKVSQTPPGTTVHLDVYRNGKTLPIAVTLEEASATGAGPGSSQGAGQGSALAGVQVQTLTADIANQLGLSPGTTGVVVTSIDPSSPAADALQRGVVIQEVNHKKVANITEYDQAVQAAGNKPVLLLVNMRGQTGYVVISPSGQ